MGIATPSELAADTTMGDIYLAILPFILRDLKPWG
jgi:uncharacterized protein YqjF (DUF2071 family)